MPLGVRRSLGRADYGRIRRGFVGSQSSAVPNLRGSDVRAQRLTEPEVAVTVPSCECGPGAGIRQRITVFERSIAPPRLGALHGQRHGGRRGDRRPMTMRLRATCESRTTCVVSSPIAMPTPLPYIAHM